MGLEQTASTGERDLSHSILQYTSSQITAVDNPSGAALEALLLHEYTAVVATIFLIGVTHAEIIMVPPSKDNIDYTSTLQQSTTVQQQ